MRNRFPIAMLSAGLLMACDALDRADLEDRVATSAQASANCASCHAYPLKDIHHAYHLFNADTARIVKNVNGRITCLDCHNDAMAARVHLLLDSICRDDLKPSGWSSFDEQEDFRKCLAGNPLLRIDTIRQNRPVPAAARPGKVALLEEWVTSLAHMNGRVDVKFDPRVDDTVEHPDGAHWDPENLTCSAVACHEKHGHYRWASPSRGLSGLHGHGHGHGE